MPPQGESTLSFLEFWKKAAVITGKMDWKNGAGGKVESHASVEGGRQRGGGGDERVRDPRPRKNWHERCTQINRANRRPPPAKSSRKRSPDSIDRTCQPRRKTNITMNFWRKNNAIAALLLVALCSSMLLEASALGE